MNDYQRAIDIYEEVITHRRYFHQYPEVNLEMPMAKDYIKKQLERMKIKVEVCGNGLIAMIGKGSPCILLRADMDALRMREDNDLPFKSKNENAHTCGHDFHAAMLLGCAKLLKQEEALLKGSVKLMFQPAEESLQGAQDMIEHGVLQNPKVDVALALHVAAGNLPIKLIMYQKDEVMMAATCKFQIKVNGQSGHSAYPHKAIDAIYISNQLMNLFNSLIPKEFDLKSNTIFSITKIHGGENYNVICDEVVMEGSIRSFEDESLNHLCNRMNEIANQLSNIYHCEIKIAFSQKICALKCDPFYTNKFIQYIKELNIENMNYQANIQANASEDFAFIAAKVPSVYFYISAGIKDHLYHAHHPKVLFHEDALIYGVSYLTHISKRYLQEYQKNE